jgi:ribosomal protein S18 acetylase RimI-like enzyme
MTGWTITPVATGEDRDWVRGYLKSQWGDFMIATRGRLQDASELSGLLAWTEGERVGLATYQIANGECELVTLNSIREGQGVGRLLLRSIEAEARRGGCRRVWMITTNDNLKAIGFYQKCGYRLVAVHRDALRVSRSLKPVIPEIGESGIPILDEIELERIL